MTHLQCTSTAYGSPLAFVRRSVEHEHQLKRYWQHAGEVVSSRVAVLVLEQLQDPKAQAQGHHSVPLATADTVAALRSSLADLSGANAEDICTLMRCGLAPVLVPYPVRPAASLCIWLELTQKRWSACFAICRPVSVGNECHLQCAPASFQLMSCARDSDRVAGFADRSNRNVRPVGCLWVPVPRHAETLGARLAIGGAQFSMRKVTMRSCDSSASGFRLAEVRTMAVWSRSRRYFASTRPTRYSTCHHYPTWWPWRGVIICLWWWMILLASDTGRCSMTSARARGINRT